ncbi:MAG: hypothetical protein U0903_20220 [Planctomycetales bacterium]
MIFLGIDDTDMPETPGTNQLARKIATAIREQYRCLRIVRHQLCGDPSIPCTSKNGSASLWLEPLSSHDSTTLLNRVRRLMLDNFIPGSDPGLCLALEVPLSIQQFGLRAKEAIVTQSQARTLAHDAGMTLIGLGGTEGGVIGALAAVGLAATGNDGRIVQIHGWEDDLYGKVDVTAIRERGIVVRSLSDQRPINHGIVDLVKKLRPNCSAGEIVLNVIPGESDSHWIAVKAP